MPPSGPNGQPSTRSHSPAANVLSLQSVPELSRLPNYDGSDQATNTEKIPSPDHRSSGHVRITVVDEPPAARDPSHPIPKLGDYRVPGFPMEGPCLSAKEEKGMDSDYWSQLLAAVEKHDNELCTTWREDIDTLLVFAGLFTAIVTAFTIESYQWLQPAPEDVTNVLLLGLSKQLADSTLPPLLDPAKEFMAPPYAIRINSLWFLSITLSLAAGLIGLLCKQWMREFQRDASLPAKDALALRQLRWLGWERWGVPHIISLPALLLQTSLFLFFGGLLDLLWSRIQAYLVAAFATGVVALIGLTFVLTTCLPLVSFLSRRNLEKQRDLATRVDHDIQLGPSYTCPFRSPQSYLFLKLWDLTAKLAVSLQPFHHWTFPVFGSWLQVERTILQRKVRQCATRGSLHSLYFDAIHLYRSLALQWVRETLAFNHNIRVAVSHCILETELPCRERSGESHFGIYSTKRACEADRQPYHIYDSLLADSDHGLQLELLLRSIGARPTMDRVPATLWDKLFTTAARSPVLELHPLVSRQLLQYAGSHIRSPTSTSNTLGSWKTALGLCLNDPRHEDILIDVLQNYCDTLQYLPDKRCTDLIKALFILIFRRGLPNGVLQSATFLPLMNALKRSRRYLNPKEDPGLGSGTIEELYQKLVAHFLSQTSPNTLPRHFFDDDGSQTPGPHSDILLTYRHEDGDPLRHAS